jgi:hypothetical protein
MRSTTTSYLGGQSRGRPGPGLGRSTTTSLITSNGDGPILDERNDHFNFELRNIPGRQPRLLIISRSSAEAECYVVANGMET